MGLHDPFGYLKISYGQKKGQESNCQFDFRPLKIKNRPDLVMCKWHLACRWKSFDKGYNFALDLTSIGGLQKQVMGLQSRGGPHFRNIGTPKLGIPGQNDIWVHGLWPGTKNIIRGKVVASPSPSHGESCESMFARGFFVHQKCSNYALNNFWLFGLCRSV
jgi:hypothetical protein